MLEPEQAKTVADAVKQIVRAAAIETEKASKKFNTLDENRANAQIVSRSTGTSLHRK